MKLDESVFHHATWARAILRPSQHDVDVQGVELGDVLAASASGDPAPWWAHVWPAGIDLADRILAGERLDGISCLDLGAGAGIVGVALAVQGARVTFGDASPRALELSRENAERNGICDFDVLLLPASVPAEGRFARIYASDVLYEGFPHEALSLALRGLLAPGGVAFIADPKRGPVEAGLKEAAQGFEVTTLEDSAKFLLVRLTPVSA